MNLRYLVFLATAVTVLLEVFTPSFAKTPSVSLEQKLTSLEAASGGRLGASAINTSDNTAINYHSEKRFPMCSTSKTMVVSAILKESMQHPHLLKQKITYQKKDLVTYSPVTEKHIKNGMTFSELCAATMTQSDNTAMNLLMKKLGGPSAVTQFARSIKDFKFRLDRWEPELNSAIPGDLRDTSTPSAMAKSLQQLVLGSVLASSQREQLQTWLKNNTTGNSRIRAGTPKDWVVGDKTGTGDYGTTNDIGIVWPPRCSPIVIAIYFTQSKKDAVRRDDVIASATRILMDEFSRTDRCLQLNQDKANK